jgi:hypothetical protein
VCAESGVVDVADAVLGDAAGRALGGLRPKMGSPSSPASAKPADWVLVAGRSGARETRAALLSMGFGSRADSLVRGPAQGYRVRYAKTGRSKAIVVVGGDRASAAEGLADVWANSETCPEGLFYRGGEVDERPAFALRYFRLPTRSAAGRDLPNESLTRAVDRAVTYRANAVMIEGPGEAEAMSRLREYARARGVAVITGAAARAVSERGPAEAGGRGAVPLAAFLDDGVPAEMSPARLSRGSTSRPAARARWETRISAIKEACLDAARTGRDRIGMDGGASDRSAPRELEYLTFSHFTFHPRATLRDFARAQLAPRIGGEEPAERYVEIMAAAESGRMTVRLETELAELSALLAARRGAAESGLRLWRWLAASARRSE